MPWNEIDTVDRRYAFAQEAMQSGSNITALCRHYGISRQTGYLTLERFRRGGIDGLAARPSTPLHNPQAWPSRLRDEVLGLRRQYGWGGKKLRLSLLRKDTDRLLPSASTFDRWIEEAGLSQPRGRRRKRIPGGGPILKAEKPNQVLAVDFKGEFKLGNGQYCYPLTVTDLYSRYLVDCVALPGPLLEETRQCFERIFARNGLPERIHSDNGTPFASTGIGNHSRLSVWWLQLGIVVERSRPAHPQDNAAHERMHRTLKQATTRPPERTFVQQQKRFDEFREVFNHERPHDGIGGRVPADLYRPSPRRVPDRLEDWDYPGYFETRRVASNGCIGWRGAEVSVGKPYAGQLLGLNADDEQRWIVYLGDLELGVLDEKAMRLDGYADELDVANRRRLP